MSMHTELMTVNKRDWENMVKLLRERDEEINQQHKRIEAMTAAIAKALELNGYKAIIQGSCVDDCPNSY